MMDPGMMDPGTGIAIGALLLALVAACVRLIIDIAAGLPPKRSL